MGVRLSIYSRMCTDKVFDKRHSSKWHCSMPRTKQLQPTSKNNFDHEVRFEVSFSWKSSTNGRCFSFTRVISLRPFSISVFLLSFFRDPFFFYFISHGRGIYHERQWKFRFPRAKISEFPPRTRSSPHRFPYSCKSGSLDDIFPRTFYTSLSPIRESNPLFSIFLPHS